MLIVGMYGYSGTENKPTYSKPAAVAKMVEYSLAISRSEDNPLYADDMDVKHDKGILQNGELSLTTNDLTQEVSKKALGIRAEKFTYNTDGNTAEGIYDDKHVTPYLDIGVIRAHQSNDVTEYRAILLPRMFFNIPGQAVMTKGESIEWQIPTIIGTVMYNDLVDDKYGHPWTMGIRFQARAEATLYLKYRYGKANA